MKSAPFLVGLCLAALFVTMSESFAKVTIAERTTYYSVSGRTGKDIYKQIVAKGPRLPGKKGTHVAKTTMSFKFRNIRVDVRGNRCVVLNLDVHVTAVYNLPRWNGKGSPKLQAAWKNFNDHVWRHEQRHRDIGLEFARRMESGAKALSGDARRGCAGFEEAAQRLLARSSAWHNRKQAAFDASWFGDGGRQFKYDRALVATD